MSVNISNILDFQRINELLEGFNKTTGFVTAIIDLDGNVLSKSGWRSVCEQYHRVHPGTSQRCRTSDTELSAKMGLGEKYHYYTCLNGLVDVAVPLVIEGEHVANLFTGQFFLEEPDFEFFKNQAAEFNFDETDYLQRIREVPVISMEKVKPAMEFLLSMTEMIAEITMQRYQHVQLFNSMLDGCALHRIICNDKGEPVDYRFLEVNPAFERMTGLMAADIIGKTVLEVLPGTEQYWIDIYGKVALTGESVTFSNKSKNLGKHFEVAAFRPANMQFACVFKDITERKKTEEALLESEERLELVLEGSRLGYWDWDIDSGKVYRNKIWAEMLGYTLEEIEQNVKQWTDLHHPDDKEAAWESIHLHLEGKTPEHKVEYRMRAKDGNYVWILDQARIVKWDSAGKPLRMSGTHTDITARKNAEQEIHRLNTELEERVKTRTAQLESAVKELEAFTYSVSHDLRAPLRAINGYSSILKEEFNLSLDKEAIGFLDKIIVNTRQMSELIDDLLRLSRISKQELIRVPVEMKVMVQSVFEELSPAIPSGRIRLIIHDLPLVEADIPLLRIALYNLMSNAIKFSSGQEIQTIEFGFSPEKGGMYYIRDNGVGFSMTYSAKLFEVFQRLHRADEFEGWGIGLAIVKRIIQKHEGKIFAESEPGKGACFYFRLN